TMFWMLDLISREVQLQMFAHQQRFRDAAPFPHISFDGFLREDFARELLDNFPKFNPDRAKNELGEVGRKAVNTNVRDLPEPFRRLDDLVQSADFLQLISGITGIPDLLYDPEYVGGGTHENLSGQELDPHADFNYHPRFKWHRRLNLLLYLNPEWKEEWGGSIELHSNPWNPDQNKIISFAPLMNRCVIFETSEKSWHGFRQVQLPEGKRDISRKSVALYFYTKDRPAVEIFPEHGTFYVHRPLPDQIKPGYTLTDQDIQELKNLLIKRDSWIHFLYDRELQWSASLGDKQTEINRLMNGQPPKQEGVRE